MFISFKIASNDALNASTRYNEDTLYHLHDTLFQPDLFSAYRKSANALAELSTFYTLLNNEPLFTFSSAFNQNLPISQFKGNETFAANYEKSSTFQPPLFYFDEHAQQELIDLKSMQLNEQSFNYYQLTLEEGKGIDWPSVSMETFVIPIILGYNYKTYYQLGDHLQGFLYFREFSFEVVGFLAKNSVMYYNLDANWFLDDYLLIPYPSQLPLTATDHNDFYAILYFAMINGNLLVDNKHSLQTITAKLNSISQKSGFDDYSLLGVDTFFVQMTKITSALDRNQQLVIAIFVFIFSFYLYLSWFLTKLIFKRRQNRYLIAHLLGQSSKSIAITYGLDGFSDSLFALLLLIGSLKSITYWSFKSLAILLFCLVLYFITCYYFYGALLAKYLKQNQGLRGDE